MRIQFIYNDGQGHDEHGVEPMSLVNKELFAIETTGCRTQSLMSKPLERPSNPAMYPSVNERNSEGVDMRLCNKRRNALYSDDEKTRFSQLFFSKYLSAFATVRQLGIYIRAAPRWVKHFTMILKAFPRRRRKLGHHRMLGERHKQFLLHYMDETTSAVLTEVGRKSNVKFCRFKGFL